MCSPRRRAVSTAERPFTVLGSLPSGYQLVYNGTSLDLNQVITVSNGQYTLTSTPASLNVHVNGTTTVATVIANTGGGTQDALNYSALASSVSSGGTSGSVGTATGTTSGTNLAQGTNNSPGTSQTFTATSTKGNVTLTNASTVSNVTATGTPVGTHSGATINVYSRLEHMGDQRQQFVGHALLGLRHELGRQRGLARCDRRLRQHRYRDLRQRAYHGQRDG